MEPRARTSVVHACSPGPRFSAREKQEWRFAAASVPLYRQRPGERFWFEWMPQSGTVYVNLRNYENLRAKSRELWSFVDANPVRKIAFDVRQNGGGDCTWGGGISSTSSRAGRRCAAT